MNLPLAKGSGVTTIVGEIRKAIQVGSYDHGQRLPAERDLAVHFGASRATVRGALGLLAREGMVIRKVGSGTFANRPRVLVSGDIATITSPLELTEVRAAIEPHLAQMAVGHASANDLEKLENMLDAVEACGDDRAAFSEADEAFHMALAEATGNPLMVWIYGRINDVRCHEQWSAMKQKVLDHDSIAIYNRQHRAMTEAIRRRDARTAMAVVRDHLDQVRRDLTDVGDRVSR